MASCVICEQSSESGMNRVGGADVCEPCMRGLAPSVIRSSRGWDFDIRQWSRITRDGETLYYACAQLRFGGSPALHFKCRRKNLLWSLLSLVNFGMASGDELFDGHAHVSSKSPADVRAILSDDGGPVCFDGHVG